MLQQHARRACCLNSEGYAAGMRTGGQDTPRTPLPPRSLANTRRCAWAGGWKDYMTCTLRLTLTHALTGRLATTCNISCHRRPLSPAVLQPYQHLAVSPTAAGATVLNTYSSLHFGGDQHRAVTRCSRCCPRFTNIDLYAWRRRDFVPTYTPCLSLLPVLQLCISCIPTSPFSLPTTLHKPSCSHLQHRAIAGLRRYSLGILSPCSTYGRDSRAVRAEHEPVLCASCCSTPTAEHAAPSVCPAGVRDDLRNHSTVTLQRADLAWTQRGLFRALGGTHCLLGSAFSLHRTSPYSKVTA